LLITFPIKPTFFDEGRKAAGLEKKMAELPKEATLGMLGFFISWRAS